MVYTYSSVHQGRNRQARAPKPGKTPIMAARRRVLFFKIELRLVLPHTYGAPVHSKGQFRDT